MSKADQILFPQMEIGFTTTEMNELAVLMNKPVVIRYLTLLAQKQVKAISHGMRMPGESAESFLERQAVVAGGLAAIKTLLDIEPANTAATS